MADREKVMHDLERVIVFLDARSNMATPGSDGQMLLTGWTNSVRTVLAMLKEAEPHVLTPRKLDEVWLSKPVWLEVRNMDLLEPALFRYQMPEYGNVAFSLIENRAIKRDVTEYNLGWRCWTSRPSPEQMRDTPWGGEQ